MTKSTHKQKEVQRQIIIDAGHDPATLFVGSHSWWFNPTNHNSLRLTKFGVECIIKVGKKFPTIIDLPDEQKILPKQLLQLERQFTEPYYIKNPTTLWVFGETDAIMLQLHAGNLRNYLNSLEDSAG